MVNRIRDCQLPRCDRLPLVAFACCLFWAGGCRHTEPVQNLAQLALPKVNSRFRLVDVTEQTGVLAKYSSGHEAGHHTPLQWLGGGVAVLDFDNDSQLDLVFAGGGKLDDKRITGIEPSLYRNLGSFQFDDVTASAAMSIVGTYTHGCHAADFNNDGFVDVLITGYERLQLFQNQGDGTFRDVTQDCSLNDTLLLQPRSHGLGARQADVKILPVGCGKPSGGRG